MPEELPRIALGKQTPIAEIAQGKAKGESYPVASDLTAVPKDTWLGTGMPPLPLPLGDDKPVTTSGEVPQVMPAAPEKETLGEPAKERVFTKARTIALDAEHAPFVEMVFDAEGEEKTVRIFKRPLGAEFSKRSLRPTKVSKVDYQSYAWNLGIEVGWVLKSVDGEDVIAKSFRQAQDMIRSSLLTLPERTA